MNQQDTTVNHQSECPVCEKYFPANIIQQHVDKCIFLYSLDEGETLQQKRKKPTSPPLKNKAVSSNMEFNAKRICSEAAISQPNILAGTQTPNNNDKPRFSFKIPLAKQVEPKCLNEFVGQNHILGHNSLYRTLLEKKEISNFILWGPPGCGKTSLAGVLQGMAKEDPKHLKCVMLCAANAGIKDIENVVTAAKADQKYDRKTILFVDEIHRFNKRQQDVFLPHVEKGDITLVGATTENPSFHVNSALLSRAKVVCFEKLKPEELKTILMRAANTLNIDIIEDDNPEYDSSKPVTKLSIASTAVKWLGDVSDGDARIMLNNFQLVVQHNTEKNSLITVEDIKDEIKRSHLLYDKKGDEHYNLISAMHKSIRSSDDSAAVYWLTRMLVSGEDPLYIARRLIRAASEDIGNADPNALNLAVNTMQGCQLLGLPECDVLLTQCAIYLARAPKSREADTALAQAKKLISECKGTQPDVPLNLRNAPTQLMKDLGYGKWSRIIPRPCMPPRYENVNFFR